MGSGFGGFEEDAVDDGFDGVVLAAIEGGRFGEIVDFAIDAGAEALLVELVEEIFEFTLAAADDGRHDGDAFALAEFEDSLHDLVGCLPCDGPATVGAVGRADGSVEKAQA